MIKIIEENRLYFGLYFATFLLVFIWQLNHDLLTATLFFSANRSAFGDFFFRNWTYLGEVAPFVTAVLFFIYQKKYASVWQVLIVGLTTMFIVGALKDGFAHPRPMLVLENFKLETAVKYVEDVEILRGQNSFPSGHTAAAFGVWSLLAFYFSRNKLLQIVLFSTAFLVGVSRVYLIAHFPEDTLFGSAIGLSVATLTVYFFQKFEKKQIEQTDLASSVSTVQKV